MKINKIIILLLFSFLYVNVVICRSDRDRITIIFKDKDSIPVKYLQIRINGDDKKTNDFGEVVYKTNSEKIILFVDTDIYALTRTVIYTKGVDFDTLIFIEKKTLSNIEKGVYVKDNQKNDFEDAKAENIKEKYKPKKVRINIPDRPRPNFPYLKHMPRIYNNFLVDENLQRLSDFLFDLNLPYNRNSGGFKKEMRDFKYNKKETHYKYNELLSTNFLRLLLLKYDYEDNKDSIFTLIEAINYIVERGIPSEEVRYWRKYNYDIEFLCDSLMREVLKIPRCEVELQRAELFEIKNQLSNAVNMYIMMIKDDCKDTSFLYNKIDSLFIIIDKSILNTKKGDEYLSKGEISLAKESYNKALKHNYGNISAFNRSRLLEIEGYPYPTKEVRDFSTGIIEADLEQNISNFTGMNKFPNIEAQVFDKFESSQTMDIVIQYGMDDNDRVQNSIYYNYPVSEYKYVGSDKAVEFIIKTIDIVLYRFGKLYSDSIDVKILGSSDAIPYMGSFKYKGEYGQIKNDVVCDIGEICQSFKELKRGNSDDKNKALAYLRAIQLKHSLSLRDDLSISNMEVKVNQSNSEGGAYRSVQVVLTFKWKELLSN